MYTSFFGLKENPFNLTPDPRYLFLSPSHKEAFDHLLYGINERKGFIAITGGIGTGKTTLCRALLSHLNAGTQSALIFGSYLSDVELLQTVNQEFGIHMEPGNGSKKACVDALNRFLLLTFSENGNAVLLIDEAQNLSHAVLEQIRMISNLETDREKLLQIVLIGQPELKELLSSPSLRQLDERITVRYDLKPLDRKDIQGYVEHRLVVGGGRGHVRFSSGAYKEIFNYSRGNPRRINAVCDRALLIAYARGKHGISGDVVRKALSDIRGKNSGRDAAAPFSKRRWGFTVVLLCLLMVAAGLAGWSLKKAPPRVAEKKPAVRAVVPEKPVQKPVVSKPSLHLDEQSSLAGLFRIYHEEIVHPAAGQSPGDRLSLVTFHLKPAFHVLLKKPFRVRVKEGDLPVSGTPRYFLIREVGPDHAVAVDEKGHDRELQRDVILKKWGGMVSWICPSEDKTLHLKKGMHSPEVARTQTILQSLGYLTKPTGFYDAATRQHVRKFQEDFGLMADGIVGPRTMALLYQMSN